ncbi:MAG: translation initiation factor Sui1 [Desulfuromonadales bacterium]
MAREKEKTGGLVYSSEFGRMCPACGQPADRCRCRQAQAVPPNDGVVRLRRETKGRGGKAMTVITGVPLAPAELKELGQQLKKKCATGGTVKDGVIEIQGDHLDRLLAELKDRGWTVKRSGG